MPRHCREHKAEAGELFTAVTTIHKQTNGNDPMHTQGSKLSNASPFLPVQNNGSVSLQTGRPLQFPSPTAKQAKHELSGTHPPAAVRGGEPQPSLADTLARG
jgi:hypothetical protein